MERVEHLAALSNAAVGAVRQPAVAVKIALAFDPPGRTGVCAISAITGAAGANPGGFESGHVVVTGDRRAHHADRQAGAAALAETHAKVEQGALSRRASRARWAGSAEQWAARQWSRAPGAMACNTAAAALAT